jgi:hypothetical protein
MAQWVIVPHDPVAWGNVTAPVWVTRRAVAAEKVMAVRA